MFVGPQVFDQLEDAKREVELPEYLKNSRFHKVGAALGCAALGCVLLSCVRVCVHAALFHLLRASLLCRPDIIRAAASQPTRSHTAAARAAHPRPLCLLCLLCLQGSYEGLRAWGICQLVRLGADKKGADKKGADKKGKKAKKVGCRRRCCASRPRLNRAPARLGCASAAAVLVPKRRACGGHEFLSSNWALPPYHPPLHHTQGSMGSDSEEEEEVEVKVGAAAAPAAAAPAAAAPTAAPAVLCASCVRWHTCGCRTRAAVSRRATLACRQHNLTAPHRPPPPPSLPLPSPRPRRAARRAGTPPSWPPSPSSASGAPRTSPQTRPTRPPPTTRSTPLVSSTCRCSATRVVLPLQLPMVLAPQRLWLPLSPLSPAEHLCNSLCLLSCHV